MEPMGAIAGLAVGVLHALSGPDHLAAVAPLSAARPALRWRIGLEWGLGHALGTWLIAAAVLCGASVLSVQAAAAGTERVVGVALVGLGLWGIRRALRHWLHSHAHRHGGAVHRHLHLHPQRCAHASAHRREHSHASAAIGLLHGVAGAGPLMAALPAAALPGGGLAYLVAFGVGSMLAMAAFSWALSGLGDRCAGLRRWGYPALLGGYAAFCLVVGGVWLVR